jgi:hypothetical protein
MIQNYRDNFLGKMKFIPPMPVGMYAWPRADSEIYYHYREPLPGDLADRISQTFEFLKSHPEECDAKVVFSYSWNEHSEGGWLCPTMGSSPDYTPVTNLLDEAAEALQIIH